MGRAVLFPPPNFFLTKIFWGVTFEHHLLLVDYFAFGWLVIGLVVGLWSVF